MSIRPLNSELQLIAQEELHENEDLIQEKLDILKEWLKQSAHLTARTDDQFLVAFLRRCKYSVESAKQRIDLYYTHRSQFSEVTANRDPLKEENYAVIKCGTYLPLPLTGNAGSPRIILGRMNSHALSSVKMEHVGKVFVMVNEILANEDDNSIVSGQVWVNDLADISMGHIVQCVPALVRMVMKLWIESSPIRPKAIHYINVPKAFEPVIGIVKSFLSETMKQMIFVHSSLDSLYSMVPREMLPEEYGGEVGSLETLRTEWEKKFISYRDYFLDDDRTYGVDEQKRIGGTMNPLHGIDGTFQQLQCE